MVSGYSLLFGHAFMLMSEYERARNDRGACALVGFCMNLFYLSAATHVSLKCFTIFRAVTVGYIGGWTR